MRRTVLSICLISIATLAIAASPDPIRVGKGDLDPVVFPESKSILLEELSSEGRYGPVPERHKRQIRESLVKIERMLLSGAEQTSATDEAIQVEVDQINSILARADSKVAKGRCEERKPMGSNIRLRSVCRDQETMSQQREVADRMFRQMNRCQGGETGGCRS